MPNYRKKPTKAQIAANIRRNEEREAGRNRSRDHALERANYLCAHLVGLGYGLKWRPHVWHNLGWHYSVSPFAKRHAGTELDIHPSMDHEPLGACWVSFIPDGGAQIHVNADTPAEALQSIGRSVDHIRAQWRRCFGSETPVTPKRKAPR